MKRRYTHIKMMEPEIIKMREEGKTRQEIADALGLTKTQIRTGHGDTTKNRKPLSPESGEAAQDAANTAV